MMANFIRNISYTGLDKFVNLAKIIKHNGGLWNSTKKLYYQDYLKIETFIAEDELGNKYYENPYHLVPRNRWVQFNQKVGLEGANKSPILGEGNGSGNNNPLMSTSMSQQQLIMKIKQELKSERAELEEIATYYFDGQGKAYRPMIVLLIGRAYNRQYGCDVELSEAQRVVAMVAEMIHTSSLVHDDVIDAADTRRGKPSVNVLYGQRKSILAGDYILSRASQMLARLENEQILVVLSHILLDLVRGEFMQMSNKASENKRFDHYISKSFNKTASLIAYTCRAVTLLSGADESHQEAAFEYGRNLGIGFQLIDDLLDFESSQSELGKPAAADLKLGLATAPVLYASAKFKELDDMIGRRFSEPGDVEKAYSMVMKSDGLIKTKELAQRHIDAALEQIAHLDDSEEKRALIALAQMTLDRKK